MSRTPKPFFAVSDTAPSDRRLLLISYHFPPGDAVGALRWQKLAIEAAKYGWTLDVVTVHPDSLERADTDRLRELPAGTRVFGVPARRLAIDHIERIVWNALRRARRSTAEDADPSDAARVSASPARPHSLGRDAVRSLRLSRRVAVRTYYAYLYHLRNKRWAMRAEALARRLAERSAPRAVITCGPPHEAHLAGARVARRLGVPHIIDMRDPWSLVERVPEIIAAPITYRLAAAGEARTVPHASLVVCNTEPAAEALRRRYPSLDERCIAVMNGFDNDALPAPAPGRRFLLAYAGSIYLDRDPSALFRAAARFIRRRDLSPEDFGIEFMGHEEIAAGAGVMEIAEREGVASFVRRHRPGSRSAALAFLARAAMLISLPQDSAMAIPSKVFEYMRYDAWLLALADPESATARVLSQGGADVVAPEDVGGIASVLERRFDEFARSGRPRQPALVPHASRAEQARIFFSALGDVVDGARARSVAERR